MIYKSFFRSEKMFTGNKDTDRLVLAKLNDYDLKNACMICKHLNEICKNDNFWRDRTLSRFSKYLGGVKDMKKYDSRSWEIYYKSLTEFLQDVYNGVRLSYRSDHEILRKIVLENNKKLRENISNYFYNNIGDWGTNEDGEILQTEIDKFYSFLNKELDKDMINPNILFEEDSLQEESAYLLIKYLLNSKDKRIRVNYKKCYILKYITVDFYHKDREKIFKMLVDDNRVDINILFKKNEFIDDIQYCLLPYIAKSPKLQVHNYKKLMALFAHGDKNEYFTSSSFKDFAIVRCHAILSELS